MRHFKHLFLIFIILVLLCDSYVFTAWAQTTEKVPEAPKTLKEAETVGKEILKGFPQALKEPWQQAVAVWGKIGSWFGDNVWQRIYSFLGKEVEKRKPEIKEEFEKEKQETREEIFIGTKTLWQRFLEVIHF